MFSKFGKDVYEIINKYDLNIVNLIFIGFTAVIVVLGSLMNTIEQLLPAFIRQSYRYGKHSYRGPADQFVTKMEVPKSWFAHFYVFAFTCSMFALYLVLKGIVMHSVAPDYMLDFLDFIAGGVANRKVLINSNNALVACILMTLQCARRFYETNFVQIFSKKSKINISHYVVGYLHYFAAIMALLINTEGFVRGSLPSSFNFAKISLVQYVCIFLFHLSWTQQYKSNMILVNLRKDSKTGEVSTEKHFLPSGGFFNLVSSPHMFFEIIIYVVLWAFLDNSFTWKLVMLWVLSNQIMNALLTHEWYKENFKNYPKSRKALIPFVL